MKLYFATGTCSMASVIEIMELGIDCELIEVSWNKNQNVETLDRLNPLGATPTLVTDEGIVLTQGAAILEYLADKYSKGKHLAPAGTIERVQTLSWVSFVASDFQKSFGPAFRAEDMTTSSESQKQIEEFAKKNIQGLLKHISQNLAERTYISGDQFTVADCYLFAILRWCEWVELPLSEYPPIQRYMDRMSSRPRVAKALKLEDDE